MQQGSRKSLATPARTTPAPNSCPPFRLLPELWVVTCLHGTIQSGLSQCGQGLPHPKSPGNSCTTTLQPPVPYQCCSLVCLLSHSLSPAREARPHLAGSLNWREGDLPSDVLHNEGQPALGGIAVPTGPWLGWNILVDG